jgi:hypothetical protein
MNRTLKLALLPLALIALRAFAGDTAPQMSPEEQAMMAAYRKAATPGPAHEQMTRMAGTYDMKISSWQAPGAPPSVESGVAVRRMILGGRVMVEDAEAKMQGQPFTGQGLHGYDNVSGKHWATWTDSLGTGLMVSEGDCDAAGACNFIGSWNDPISKGKITARMTTRWTDANTEVFEMHGPGPDGKEMKMMEIVYTRRQP